MNNGTRDSYVVRGQIKVLSCARIILFSFAALFCSQAIAENVEFRTAVDSWILPADSRFSNRIVVTVINSETKEPVQKLRIGAVAQRVGSILTKVPSGAGAREIQVVTDKNGEAVFFYKFDKSISPDSVRFPCQEKVSVFCTEFSYEKTVFLSVGIDVAFGNGAPRIPPPWYPFEKIPLQLTVNDISHPIFDLRTFGNMLNGSSLQIVADEYEATLPSLDWSRFKYVFGGLAGEAMARSESHKDLPVLLNASRLKLYPTGTADYLLSSSSGIPSLLFKRSGTFSLKLRLNGIRGDSSDANNTISLVIPLPTMPSTPFNKVLELYTQAMPDTMGQNEYGFFSPLLEGDLIGFGDKYSTFINDLAKALHNKASRKTVSELTLRQMLLSFLLVDVLDNFAANTVRERKTFFRHISLSAPVTNLGLPMNDWIDSVVYGFLKKNSSDSVLFFECADSFDVTKVKVTAGGKTYTSVKAHTIPADSCSTIVGTGRKYGALTYKRAKGVDSVIAVVPKGVKGIIHYSLEKNMLMILRASLDLSEASKISFKAGVAGKGKVSVTGISTTTHKEVVGLVASSQLEVPSIASLSKIHGKIFKTIPETVKFKVNCSRKLKSGDFKMFIDETPLSSVSLAKDHIVEATLPLTLQPGVHVVTLDYKEFSGVTGQHKCVFLNYKEVSIPANEPPWELRGRTGKAPTGKLPKATKKPHNVAATAATKRPSRRPRNYPSSGASPGASSTAVAPNDQVGTNNEHTQTSGEPVEIDEISDAELYGSPVKNTVPAPVHKPVPVIPTEVAIASGSGLSVSQVKICTTIENNKGLGSGSRFVSGIPKLFCWYRFSNTADSSVELSTEWYYFSRKKGSYILSLRGSKLLPSGSGSAFTPIARGGGKALPDGKYRVELKSGGNVIDVVPFSIGFDN